MNSFYTENELKDLSLASFGKNVRISRKASIYSPEKINIGDNVRIDDFCILSGRITIGDYVHVAAGVYLYGGNAGITFENYTTISSRSAVYAVTDDYSGASMTNPQIPEKYRGDSESSVVIRKHCIIGTGCTVLPGVSLESGTAVGAMSLINKNTEAWGIYAGIPAVRKAERKKDLLKLCEQFEETI